MERELERESEELVEFLILRRGAEQEPYWTDAAMKLLAELAEQGVEHG